ncbi:hypothetical protein [Candidatus Scalindua japonica]|nr:hypothetical protein [Candidatus Scalindua japonica]
MFSKNTGCISSKQGKSYVMVQRYGIQVFKTMDAIERRPERGGCR